jgi:hypothetical protein
MSSKRPLSTTSADMITLPAPKTSRPDKPSHLPAHVPTEDLRYLTEYFRLGLDQQNVDEDTELSVRADDPEMTTGKPSVLNPMAIAHQQQNTRKNVIPLSAGCGSQLPAVIALL